MKINRTSIALGSALAVAFVAIVFTYTNNVSSPAVPAQQAISESATVSLTVQSLYTSKQVSITSGETVLQLLQALNATDQELQLSTKTYAGMGALVDGMHGLKNGADKKYWQYKVNGVMPQVGAGADILKSGDSVEWFFGPSQE